MASPPADFQVHNSLFLIAHFHTHIIGIALFGVFAGITYWFPKIMGFTLDERLGKWAFWLWLIGFFVSFIPLYLLGFMGATRRTDRYDSVTGWQPLFILSSVGFAIITSAIIVQIAQLIVSFREREKNRDRTGDPWNGRTLEWSTSSPPPFYNFAVIPKVEGREAYWNMKRSGERRSVAYGDIELPRNTGMGIYIAGFAFLLAFSLVWYILWLGIVGALGVIACIIIRSFDEDTEYRLAAAKVAEIERGGVIVD